MVQKQERMEKQDRKVVKTTAREVKHSLCLGCLGCQIGENVSLRTTIKSSLNRSGKKFLTNEGRSKKEKKKNKGVVGAEKGDRTGKPSLSVECESAQ